MPTFQINPDMSERVDYNQPDFPVRTSGGDIADLYGFRAECHWHQDFEVLTPLDASIDYFVNGEIYRIQPDDAIFVNSGRLHYGFKADGQSCKYRFVVYHPSIFGAFPPIQSLVDRLAADTSPDALVLTGKSDQERDALRYLNAAIAGDLEQDALGLMSACAGLTRCLCSINPSREEGAYDESWMLLRGMTGYVQANYQELIRVDDIAAAAAVCRSKCCRLFREKLHCSPGEYVTQYRLQKACAMLREGSSVSEAALSTGFHGVSYFSETFKRVYGLTPKEYRANRA